jgi:hypothetical protein
VEKKLSLPAEEVGMLEFCCRKYQKVGKAERIFLPTACRGSMSPLAPDSDF